MRFDEGIGVALTPIVRSRRDKMVRSTIDAVVRTLGDRAIRRVKLRAFGHGDHGADQEPVQIDLRGHCDVVCTAIDPVHDQVSAVGDRISNAL